MASHHYSFRRVERTDLPRLRRWLEQPHVARWWGDPDAALAEMEEAMAEPSTRPFIILLESEPVGYIQSYDIHAEANHPYRDQPPGTIGIDLTIGEPHLVGKGHGPRIIDAFVGALFDGGAPRIVIDPDPANAAAIRAYSKAGFRPVGQRITQYGPALIMARDTGNGPQQND
jgi:aminoglycoside 6'-N-acetyltransferase